MTAEDEMVYLQTDKSRPSHVDILPFRVRSKAHIVVVRLQSVQLCAYQAVHNRLALLDKWQSRGSIKLKCPSVRVLHHTFTFPSPPLLVDVPFDFPVLSVSPQ